MDSQGGTRATPHSPDEAISLAPSAEAVANGPMFDTGPGTWADYRYGMVLYRHFDSSTGVDIPSSRSSQGMTISVMPDGTTSTAMGDAVAAGARVAVQFYPALVVNGVVQDVADESFPYVAAVVVMSDGRMGFVVGRNMSLPTFAQRLADAGAVQAGYTDGGGSAAIITPTVYVGSSEHRRVLTWLVARVPSGSAAVQGGVILVGLAVVGASWWLLRRRP